MSILRDRLDSVRDALEDAPAHLSDQRLSRSILAGLLVAAYLPSDESYVRVADIARGLGMNASRVHRYLQTLLAVGLIEREVRSRSYRLAR